MHAKHKELITDKMSKFFSSWRYEDVILARMTPEQLREHIKSYVQGLANREQIQIMTAFLSGMEYAKFLGGVEPKERLALLYYNIQYNKSADLPKEEL